GVGAGRENRQQERSGGGRYQKMFLHRIRFLVVAGEMPGVSSASRARPLILPKTPRSSGREGRRFEASAFSLDVISLAGACFPDMSAHTRSVAGLRPNRGAGGKAGRGPSRPAA